MNGYIKLHRCLESSFFYNDSEAVHLWIHLLIIANRSEKDVLIGLQKVNVKPGQMITSRKSIAEKTGISESKIERLLKIFERNGQIEQQANSKFRVITVVKWLEYQESEQQANSKRTAKSPPDSKEKIAGSQESLFPEIDVRKKKKESYGEKRMVSLTEDEHKKLSEKFGKDVERKINDLDYYLYQTGKKYKDHYDVILNWDRRSRENTMKKKCVVDESYIETNKSKVKF